MSLKMPKCLKHYPCNEPKNLGSQSISMTHLEEVEIKNFRGEDREIDFDTDTKLGSNAYKNDHQANG